MGQTLQWPIIQGRCVGNAFAPSTDLTALLRLVPEQQAQAGPCRALISELVIGVCALRSLVACAARVAARIEASPGAEMDFTKKKLV
jgi:hypothetical protein